MAIRTQLNTGYVFAGEMREEKSNTQESEILLVQMNKDVEIGGIVVISLIFI